MRRICHHLSAIGLSLGLSVPAADAASSGGWNPNLPAPSQTIDPPHEETLANLVLTPKAEQRLAIKLVAVKTGELPRHQLYSGQVLYPVGRTEPGTIAELQPPDSPAAITALIQAQIAGDAQVQVAEVELEAARITQAREEKLLAARSGTQQAVDDAIARVGKAEAMLTGARAQRKFLGSSLQGFNLRGQVWLRVPIYGGDVARLDRTQPATIRELAASTKAPGMIGQPVAGMPTASTNGVTVDWYYELDNSAGRFVPGQRLAARIARRGTGAGLLIPWSAVLHDIHGGMWVYEQLAPQNYVRRRVEVAFVQDGNAALTRGPKPGTKIVTAGAIELFGAEFGIGK